MRTHLAARFATRHVLDIGRLRVAPLTPPPPQQPPSQEPHKRLTMLIQRSPSLDKTQQILDKNAGRFNFRNYMAMYRKLLDQVMNRKEAEKETFQKVHLYLLDHLTDATLAQLCSLLHLTHHQPMPFLKTYNIALQAQVLKVLSQNETVGLFEAKDQMAVLPLLSRLTKLRKHQQVQVKTILADIEHSLAHHPTPPFTRQQLKPMCYSLLLLHSKYQCPLNNVFRCLVSQFLEEGQSLSFVECLYLLVSQSAFVPTNPTDQQYLLTTQQQLEHSLHTQQHIHPESLNNWDMLVLGKALSLRIVPISFREQTRLALQKSVLLFRKEDMVVSLLAQTPSLLPLLFREKEQVLQLHRHFRQALSTLSFSQEIVISAFLIRQLRTDPSDSALVESLSTHLLQQLHRMESQVGTLSKTMSVLQLVAETSPSHLDFSSRGMLTIMRKFLLMQQDLSLAQLFLQYGRLQQVALLSGNQDVLQSVVYSLAQKYMMNALFHSETESDPLQAGTLSNLPRRNGLLKNYVLFSLLYGQHMITPRGIVDSQLFSNLMLCLQAMEDDQYYDPLVVQVVALWEHIFHHPTNMLPYRLHHLPHYQQAKQLFLQKHFSSPQTIYPSICKVVKNCLSSQKGQEYGRLRAAFMVEQPPMEVMPQLPWVMSLSSGDTLYVVVNGTHQGLHAMPPDHLLSHHLTTLGLGPPYLVVLPE